MQVVFATYQSVDIIHQAQEEAGEAWQDFDLIICDEAHRTTGATLQGEDESAFVRIHDNQFVRAEKRLYMTATPRVFTSEVKNAARENDAILASMDNESLYGPVFHRLGFGKAVSLGLLTDYKVVVLAVPEEQVTLPYQSMAEAGELPLPEIAKLAGCWNALAKRHNGRADEQYGTDASPMRRAVAFAKDIKTSKQVATEFPLFVSTYMQDLTNNEANDDLEVQCEHVDGTMNAIERGNRLDWLKQEAQGAHPVCRILTNARCLSEGVDVPTLDAVLFLNPRKSQVDVIQAIGRVMRKAAGKEFGYIILPVAVPAGVSPEEALNDNKRFKVVWQVLQAIRAHDDRFDTAINAIEYNDSAPENIMVDVVQFRKPKAGTDDVFDGTADEEHSGNSSESESTTSPGSDSQPQIPGFPVSAWKDAIYAKIVKKVGNRLYWDDWSKDIADIASRYISLIDRLLEDPENQVVFEQFVESLQSTLNPSIDGAQAVEMLAQHLITQPLFNAMFPRQDFTAQNPVSKAMQGILDRLATNAMFEKEREPLAKFYTTMAGKITAIDNLAGKQEIMRTLYDKFFTKAFPAMSDRLGIVFTPVPVVDYILHSAEVAMQKHFGKSLGDEGVAIIDPFLGTGTFVSRLLQSGIISPDQLERKYQSEIFANEIVLLSYYIASVNIEQVYHQLRLEQGFGDTYREFPGITLTDTFQLSEGEGQFQGVGDFMANMERVQNQRNAPIRVIVMNPPYSAGQKSANDNNQNLKYPKLDKRIEGTYVALSTGTNKNSLYDSYFRALRWASDRIGEEGIIAFVSNSSFIDGNTADGVRLTWQDEFSDIYVYNLRGNARTQGERRRQEAGNVFGEGSRTGVAITVLVKSAKKGNARIHYAEVDDYLSAAEKLAVLGDEVSIRGTRFEQIIPNVHGDWLNQRDDSYLEYQPIGDSKTKGKPDTVGVFELYSRGLATTRDAWCYNFSRAAVESNMQRMIDNYNAEVTAGRTIATVNHDEAYVSWGGNLDKDFKKGVCHSFVEAALQRAMYRPFCKHAVYFHRSMNERVYQLPHIFPTHQHPNLSFAVKQASSPLPFAALMTNILPDLSAHGASSGCQFFSLYTWKKVDSTEYEGTLFANMLSTANKGDGISGTFDFTKSIGSQVPMVIGEYERRDNITDATLTAYREHYKDAQISKEDIFFYVYALLHHPDYRERYAADLKKMLPRIPKVHDFWSYANIGRELAELHVNYERIEAYPSVDVHESMDAPRDEWAKYHITKPAWGKLAGKRAKDYTTLVYNDYLTFTNIPEEANNYKIGGRSPLEWVIDRYKITTDSKSGIVNDPNDYCREIGEPDYIARLIQSLVTVSMRTQNLIASLPEWEVSE